MKRTNLKQLLTIDLKNQLVSLRNQGKTVSQMSEITGIPIDTLKQIATKLIQSGLWSYSERWKKRMNTVSTKTTRVKRTYTKREAKTADSITINFKGINVEVQKSSNIIITDTVIYVK